MQKIVDGLLYDTETATQVYFDEVNNRRLFMTDKGNFFTFYGNGEIVPKNRDSVKEYLGKYDVNKYIEIFGNVEEA